MAPDRSRARRTRTTLSALRITGPVGRTALLLSADWPPTQPRPADKNDVVRPTHHRTGRADSAFPVRRMAPDRSRARRTRTTLSALRITGPVGRTALLLSADWPPTQPRPADKNDVVRPTHHRTGRADSASPVRRLAPDPASPGGQERRCPPYACAPPQGTMAAHDRLPPRLLRTVARALAAALAHAWRDAGEHPVPGRPAAARRFRGLRHSRRAGRQQAPV